jgi:hypothetical protein
MGSPLPIMALDVGTNTVKGTSGITNDVGDLDSFAFTVPVGDQLVSASVAASDVAGNSGEISGLAWALLKGSANFNSGTFLQAINVLSPGTTTFSSTPLGSNTYNLTDSGFTITNDGTALSDYTSTFVVEAIPTAAPEAGMLTIWLTLFGLAVGAKTCRKLVVGKQ